MKEISQNIHSDNSKPTQEQSKHAAQWKAVRNEVFSVIHSTKLKTAPGVKGVLFSQIGYDKGRSMRVLLRLPAKDLVSKHIFCELAPLNDEIAITRPFQYWGNKWGIEWWIADFGIVEHTGEWNVFVVDDGQLIIEDRSLRIGKNLLWNKTIYDASVGILKIRKHFSKVGGWQDAGVLWVESVAQSAAILGLLDLLEKNKDELTSEFVKDLCEQIILGCDYLVDTHDKAFELGFPKGAMSHDLMSNSKEILPRDAMVATIALYKASRLLAEKNVEKVGEYRRVADSSFKWVTAEAKPINTKGFSFIQRNLSDASEIPDGEWMTRDLISKLQATLERWKITKDDTDKLACKKLAEAIANRQVKQSPTSEYKYYGHFLEFDSTTHTENAWIHGIDKGVFGCDLGGIFPNCLLPIIEMLALWPSHKKAADWNQLLKNFTYGYLIPVCEENPFKIIPLGVFEKEGAIWFAGPFHGTNAIYGYTAALTVELYAIFNDERLIEIATANLQWIAGLNSGLTKDSLQGSVVYSADIPEKQAIAHSMMCGHGNRWAGTWFQTKGVICNGFSVGKQFEIDTYPTKENDSPTSFTDEDWIPHSASWVTALSRLKKIDSQKEKYIA